MKVKCLKTYPTEEELQILGASFYRKQAFHVTKGMEYDVLGIEFLRNSTLGTGVILIVYNDCERANCVPLCLFEITENTVSRFWECRILNNDNMLLFPHSFCEKYYFDDLFEGKAEVVGDFRKIVTLLKTEFIYDIKLPWHIKTVFLDFLNERMDLISFEQWVYATKELEKLLSSDDYYSLISINYNEKGIKLKIKEMLFAIAIKCK